MTLRQRTYSQTLSGLDTSQLNRKYKVESVPPNIFSGEECLEQLNDIIYRLETVENVQEEIDTLYEKLVSTLHTEMNSQLKQRC